MGILDHTLEQIDSTPGSVLFQEHLDECFEVAIRILSDEALAEEAVLSAIKKIESATGDLPGGRLLLEDAVVRTAEACLDIAKKSTTNTLPRHPSRRELNNYSELLICGMSALPIEGRVVVELLDRQRVSVSKTAQVVGFSHERVHRTLHSCRLFLLEYFHLSRQNGSSNPSDR